MAALSTLALLALSAAKTATTYSSDRRAATIAEQQGNAQAGLIRTNATLADAQGADAIARGDQAASGVNRETRLLGGSQRSALAAQGVDVGSGSAADVVGNDQTLGALDALTLKNNAMREAWGFQTQAAGYRSEADWAQAAGVNQAKALRTQGSSTLLGGAGDLLNIWDSAPKGVGRGTTGPMPGATSVSVPRPSFLPTPPRAPKAYQ